MNEKRIKEEVKEDLEDILKGDGKKLVEDAEKLGEYLGRDKKKGGCGLTTSQIRNVFGEVKRVEENYEKVKYNLQMLRAKLAYTAGRHREASDLQDILDVAITKVNNNKKLRRFKDFFEAIVAYHRKYGKE